MLNDRHKSKQIDPITSQVVLGALENTAIEMGHKLARMSYSSLIRESEDYGCALIDVKGEQLCESAYSTPLQSGPIPGYVRGMRKIMESRGDEFYPGDVIMHNSAYHGASHSPDFAFCVPVFYKDMLIGFSVTTAHHLDIGSLTPGSCGIVEAADAYAEGLQFKAIKVYEKGRKNKYVWDILQDNIRTADMVIGDMEAQIAAARIGAKRYIEIVEKYGLDMIKAATQELANYSEQLLRNAIKKLPDGEYFAEGYFDGYLDSDDPMKKDLKIAVTVKIKDSDMTIDLTGTSPQINDKTINMPLEGTVDIAIYLTLRSILLDSDLYGNIPQNSGLTKPISIIAPKGSLCNPIYPAPTICRIIPGNFVADTLMKALGQVVPKQISAGVASLQLASFSGIKDEDYWVYMESIDGSYGGRYRKDGMDAVDTLYANTRNNPIEDIESHQPLRVERYELRNDAGGAGEWRGGISSIREVTFLSDGAFSVEGDGHKYKPWGFNGGHEGIVGGLSITKSDENEPQQLPSKLQNFVCSQGDKIRIWGPCGGGYGDPYSRDSKKVQSDVLDGYISRETAYKEYGVVLTETNEIDQEATEKYRASV